MRFGMNCTTRIPNLFLTAQTMNPPRFPLHVPNESIADKHPISIQIFCRKLRCRCQRILCIIFGVQDQVSYTVSRLYWPVYAPERQISHLPVPPPSLSLSLSRFVGRVGENPANEVGSLSGWTQQGSFLHEHARPLTCQRARDQWLQLPCCIVIGTKLFILKTCLRLKW